MADYSIDALDDTKPANSNGARWAAEELRALKAYLKLKQQPGHFVWKQATGDVTIGGTTLSKVGPPLFTYIPGSHNLMLFRNGLLLLVTDQYTETSPTVVTLATPVASNDVFIAKVFYRPT